MWPHFLVCHEYFSNHFVYEKSLLFHHQWKHCNVDPLVIYTSLRLSALSIIWTFTKLWTRRRFLCASRHTKPMYSRMWLFQAGLLIVLFSEVEAGQVFWEHGTMLIWGSPASEALQAAEWRESPADIDSIVLHFGHLASAVIPSKTNPSHMQDPLITQKAHSYPSCVGSNSHQTPYQRYTSVISLWALIRGRWVSESLIVSVIGLWISLFTGM